MQAVNQVNQHPSLYARMAKSKAPAPTGRKPGVGPPPPGDPQATLRPPTETEDQGADPQKLLEAQPLLPSFSRLLRMLHDMCSMKSGPDFQWNMKLHEDTDSRPPPFCKKDYVHGG
eukprot:gene6828-30801_t